MYLTCATINRLHPSARQALSDCCDMHRNVMRLFTPEASQTMQADAHILYRVAEEAGEQRLYVASQAQPDLSRAAWLGYGQSMRQRDLAPLLKNFQEGMTFGFDVLTYPCKKVDVGRKNSVRTFLQTAEKRKAWLDWQGKKNGFAIVACREDEPKDVRGTRKTGVVQMRTVRFTGVLRITDAERFCQAYEAGIGPEKAYGLGLLMLMRR